MRANGVQALLMGAQACVLYGAAQVSRDIDLLLLADPGNYRKLELNPCSRRRRSYSKSRLMAS
jgi:hypothetical protein